MALTSRQLDILGQRINTSRIAKRQQGGKTLSYLESWDVKAHLIRVFGYGNFDTHLVEYHHVTDRPYDNNGKDMVEVIYTARIELTIRDQYGQPLCSFTEGAAGSASGPMSMLGDHHDNALKTAESDALKRCAINLGNQFGLSLYDNGTTADVVRGTLVPERGDTEEDTVKDNPEIDPDTQAALEHSLGAKQLEGRTE